ncbi:glutamate--tRNA ligase, partial [Bifidobacterium sp. M0353]|nr:glutamate--tRNA ligase [Bifidobacterium sp. M0353]
HVNGYWLRQADDERLTKDVLSRLKGREDLDLSQNNEQKIKLLMPGLKERAKNLNELAENASFLCMSIPLNFTDKAQKLL